jgi:hypothetical protein
MVREQSYHGLPPRAAKSIVNRVSHIPEEATQQPPPQQQPGGESPEKREEREFFEKLSRWQEDIYIIRQASYAPGNGKVDLGFSKKLRKWYKIWTRKPDDNWIFRVDFAVMQRMYITSLRRELALLARKCLQPNHGTIMGAGSLLKDYCKTFQDRKSSY